MYAQETEQIYIRNADLAKAETRTTPPQTSYIGNVQAYHKGAFIFCDNAILKENVLYANGHVSILQNDTIEVYADTLIYDGDNNLAYLIGEVVLINGKDTLYTTELEYNTETKQARYTNRALMKSDQSTLKSQYGTYDTRLKEAWFYEKVSIESDSLYITTDTMKFLTEIEESSWTSPGIVKTKNATLYSEKGNFNNQSKLGIFYGNAQYMEDTILATADTIIVNKESDIFILNGNAIYYSTTDTALAGRIYFDRKVDSISLERNAVYIGKDNKASGDSISYNKATESIAVVGKSDIVDGSTTLIGDNVKYDKKTKSGYATGNVIYADTIENIKLWADTLEFNGETKYVKASSIEGKKPVYASNQDGDTLYISGKILNSYREIMSKITSTVFDSLAMTSMDTLPYFHAHLDSLELFKLDKTTFKDYILAKLIQDGKGYFMEQTDSLTGETTSIIDTNLTLLMLKEPSDVDTIQFLKVDKEVVVYKSDMQMLADSLIFNGLDSVFTLFYNPIIWTDSTQMTADTISIQLKDKKIAGLNLMKNTYIISTEDFKFFNQIKGRNTLGRFKDGKLENMKVDGNAQLLYYLQDDKNNSYLGANTTEASSFLFVFNEGKINEIRHFGNPQSKILPMKGTDHESIKLEGFSLQFDNRPKGINDVFFPRQRIIPEPLPIPSGEDDKDDIDKENERFLKKN
jgi:lipopolysaccharide export system protein LptA